MRAGSYPIVFLSSTAGECACGHSTGHAELSAACDKLRPLLLRVLAGVSRANIRRPNRSAARITRGARRVRTAGGPAHIRQRIIPGSFLAGPHVQ
jgi:hypothetical protein